MLKRFFITGTDTSVGKTVVSRALLQALASSGKSVAGYKPGSDAQWNENSR